jgi:hypothetical protein
MQQTLYYAHAQFNTIPKLPVTADYQPGWIEICVLAVDGCNQGASVSEAPRFAAYRPLQPRGVFL